MTAKHNNNNNNNNNNYNNNDNINNNNNNNNNNGLMTAYPCGGSSSDIKTNNLLAKREKLTVFKSFSQYSYNLWGKILFDNLCIGVWFVDTSKQKIVVLSFLVCVENASMIWNTI